MSKHIALLIGAASIIVMSIMFMVGHSKTSQQRLSFELNDTAGELGTHKNLWGKWSVITFGFTSCPDICPSHVSRIGSAMYQLTGSKSHPKSTDQVQAVFISVDHLRDNANSLDQYIKFFHPDYVGYLGSARQLDRVTQSFKAAYSVTQGEGGEVDVLHSSLIYLVNPYGRVVKQLPFGSSADFIASEVRSLM